MLIRKGNTNKVTANFTEKEYFDASFGFSGVDSFDISPITVSGVQIVRDYFGVPMQLTSTRRSVQHELAQGRSGNGQHPLGNATDFKFLGPQAENTLLKYHEEILTKGPLFERLSQAGIKGFGLYDNFSHIDSRPTFAFWDNRITTKKKSPTLTDIYNAYNDKEDGSEDFKKAKIGVGFIIAAIVLAIALFIYFKKRKK